MRLTAPLKKSLVAKRKALEDAMDGYKQAAEYNVAEVTTAATYEMAELYRTLAHDVMSFGAAEEPQGRRARGVQLAAGGAGVPVRGAGHQGARAEHRSRAKDGVYDEWVQKSFKVLAELKPARYGKTEMTQDVVTTLN